VIDVLEQVDTDVVEAYIEDADQKDVAGIIEKGNADVVAKVISSITEELLG